MARPGVRAPRQPSAHAVALRVQAVASRALPRRRYSAARPKAASAARRSRRRRPEGVGGGAHHLEVAAAAAGSTCCSRGRAEAAEALGAAAAAATAESSAWPSRARSCRTIAANGHSPRSWASASAVLEVAPGVGRVALGHRQPRPGPVPVDPVEVGGVVDARILGQAPLAGPDLALHGVGQGQPEQAPAAAGRGG